MLAVGASSRRGERFWDAVRVNSPASVKKDYAAVEAAFTPLLKDCLLYTSDAADERSSVDLGGRRIIKKKK